MPRIEATVVVPTSPEVSFWISQSSGATRLKWDSFVVRHRLLDATVASKGVLTEVVSRHRIKMVSEMVSFKPPHQAGMRMVSGPWFFKAFAGGWTFHEHSEGTEALWRYTFSIKPAWLARVGDAIGRRVLQADIEKRMNAFAAACQDDEIIAASMAVRP